MSSPPRQGFLATPLMIYISSARRLPNLTDRALVPPLSGGNTAILTYDFVSRHHVEIFGFYYPRLFTDWWGDDWVTGVYVPGRSTKRRDVLLAHTQGMGQRYHVHWDVGKKLQAQLDADKRTLERYGRSGALEYGHRQG